MKFWIAKIGVEPYESAEARASNWQLSSGKQLRTKQYSPARYLILRATCGLDENVEGLETFSLGDVFCNVATRDCSTVRKTDRLKVGAANSEHFN